MTTAMRVLLTVAYDGTGLAGWQRQAGLPSVQGCLEEALAAIFGQPLHVEGAGRTDAGVHALAQCAHVDLPRAFPLPELLRALNGNLPPAIAVRALQEVRPDLHARFSAIGKRYLYRFRTGPERPVLARGYYHWVRRPLDLAAMRRGAAALCGEHDFASFASNPGYPRRHGTVRRVDHLHVFRRRHGVDLVIGGSGFLYNMVRTIAGTLRDVGVGKHPSEHVRAVLAACDRRAAGPTLDPGGLYLLRVRYPAGAASGPRVTEATRAVPDRDPGARPAGGARPSGC